MKITDAIQITDAKRTRDGYLVVRGQMARTGVQTYLGRELGREDMQTVAIYRPGSEVFSRDSMASYSNRPVTIEHPDDAVTAENWREHAVGHVGDEIEGAGIFVRADMLISDADAVEAIADGKRELSAGYYCDIDWTEGVTEDGTRYDGVQRNIRVNHVAITDSARGGPSCRIADSVRQAWGAAPITATSQGGQSVSTTKILVDGLSVETTEAGAQAIRKLQDRLAEAQRDHTEAIGAKDAEIGKKDAQIADLKKKALTDADVERRATERANVIDAARRLSPKLTTDGITVPAIRKAVVAAKLGDAAVEGKTDAYIEGVFDHLVALAAKAGTEAKDPVRDAIQHAGGAVTDHWPKRVFDRAGVAIKEAN